MAWTSPQFTRSQIDSAGAVLIDRNHPLDELERAFIIINNWRSSHAFPLNTFQMTLRRKALEVDRHCLVAQRIKRLSSIEQKLIRFNTMKLSQMQDIGGCRAVLSSVKHVNSLVNLYLDSDLKHRLLREDDYIEHPKPSGYRGIHLIYRYYSDRKSTYNELQIEMQFRSQLQHAWATAVETVGTFLKQALKSSQGQNEWLRFFCLMGTVIALREDSPLVPNTPKDNKNLIQELRDSVHELDVEGRLSAYGAVLQTLEDPSTKNARYFLLSLNPSAGRLTVKGFGTDELEYASTEYLSVERSLIDQPGADAVLVSVQSLAELRRAYPNYFLDTHLFLQAVKQAIK